MNNNYTIFHCHTTYSLLDSTTQPEDYINKAKELGMKAIAFTEHGNVLNWIKKKQLCDKAGIKYIHGVEAYLTETLEEVEQEEIKGGSSDGVYVEETVVTVKKKLRDNYHVILIAKNKDGLEELNNIVSIATDEQHMYYRPRISFDEYFKLSDNIIKISACVGGILSRLPDTHKLYNKFVESFDFLEVQYHNCEKQAEHNRKLLSLGKNIIAGTDTHEINEYKSECRKVLMTTKEQRYEGEEEWDLVFKTYDELKKAFETQGVLSPEEIDLAINNTNVLADMIENIELDSSFKYPDDYDDAEGMLFDKSYEGLCRLFGDDVPDNYIERVSDEVASFSKVGMCGFMLSMADITGFCHSNNIPIGAGRGSATGSLIAYLLKITDVDPIIHNTTFSRFVNDSRISLGDIDLDFAPDSRKDVFKYILDKFGVDLSCRIGIFGKLKAKSIIDMVGSYLKLDLGYVAEIKRGYADFDKRQGLLDRKYENGGMSENEYEKACSDIDNDIDAYVEKFEDIFHFYKGLAGTIVSVGTHACGNLASPINIFRSIGVRYDSKNKYWVSQCDMKCVDSLNFVKYDILGLKTLQVIRDTYRLLGKEIPSASEINWEDKNVFDELLKSPVGLFQMESDSSFSHMKKFAPKNLYEISLVNAFVRPSCDSFRESIVSREIHPTPSELIDRIFKPSFGRLVFQEQIIEFLQVACGFTGSEADNVRRAIGKKDLDLLAKWLPKIEDGYVKMSGKDEEIAKEECKEFMKVLQDAGFYSFSHNHSLAYSMITYHCALLRYYHPLEFITAYLNNSSNDDDTIDGTKLADIKGIKILNPEYGMSIGEYKISNGAIYKGIGSVLNVSNVVAEDLYQLSKAHTFSSLPSALKAIMKLKSTNTKNIGTLIKVDFFKSFCKGEKALRYFELYQKYNDKKQIKKEGIPSGTEKLILKAIENNVDGFSETKSLYRINSDYLLNSMFSILKDNDFDDLEKLKYELSYLGYTQSQFDIYYGVVQWAGVMTINRGKKDEGKANGVKVKIGDTERWYKLKEGLTLPKKGDIITISGEAKGWISGYNTIALDRNKK